MAGLEARLNDQQEQLNRLAASVAQMRGQIKKPAQNGHKVVKKRDVNALIERLAGRGKGVTVGDLSSRGGLEYHSARDALRRAQEQGLLVEVQRRMPVSGERGPSRRCWRLAAK